MLPDDPDFGEICAERSEIVRIFNEARKSKTN